MGVPQRITVVTLGARDLASLRRFYRNIGWAENEWATESYASFDCGSLELALYPIDSLQGEAAPDLPQVDTGAWNGITLAMNFADRTQVEHAYAEAVRCGAVPVAEPTERDWGGYSCYVADPEGNRWELAWAPGFDDF